MKILIACEESQRVCEAFRKKGHEAYSCDILPCSGGHPEWHIQGDVLEHLNENWDMMIAHPPCTYLTCTGNRWFLPKYKDRFPTREQDRKDAIEFFTKLINAPIEKICVENPVGIMSRIIRKPEQIIQPFQFGHKEAKKTCLWLKNLPLLKQTKIVEPEYTTFKSGKRMATWYCEALKLPAKERSILRSKTFQGIADAMADQWG
jgi:hypothetical protein